MNRLLLATSATTALLLGACAPEDLAADADLAASPSAMEQAPVPVGVNTFVVGELDPGFSTRVTWADLPRGAHAQIYMTQNGTGAGPCPSGFGGYCFDILGPLTLVGTGQADRAGVMQTYIQVPRGAPRTTYTFQAVADSPRTGFIFSPTYERWTGPLICPLIYSPVCGVDRNTWDNECVAESVGTVVRAYRPCP